MSDDQKPEPTAVDGEIVSPDPLSGGSDVYHQTMIALVDNYTDRPDLLIDALERHDPGFVRRMNEASEAGAKELRDARFRFGRFQAYFATIVSGIAALAVLAAVVVAVVAGGGFWVIVGLGLFYAVTQSGPAGFARLIRTISDLIKGEKPPDDDPS